MSVCVLFVAAAFVHEAVAQVPDWLAAIVPVTLYDCAAPLPVPPAALVPSTYCRLTRLSVTVIVAAPGGTAAPVPACSPNVQGSVLVHVAVNPPFDAVAAPPWNDVYVKSSAVTVDSEQVELSVMLTLNCPDVFAASVVAAQTTPAAISAAKSFFMRLSLFPLSCFLDCLLSELFLHPALPQTDICRHVSNLQDKQLISLRIPRTIRLMTLRGLQRINASTLPIG